MVDHASRDDIRSDIKRATFELGEKPVTDRIIVEERHDAVRKINRLAHVDLEIIEGRRLDFFKTHRQKVENPSAPVPHHCGVVALFAQHLGKGRRVGLYLFHLLAVGKHVLQSVSVRILRTHHGSHAFHRAGYRGEALGKINSVTAMTDITGFGLLGHLIEMAEGGHCSAEINYSLLPVADGVKEYLAQRIVPDATYRNWNSYSTKTAFEKGVNVMEAFNLLPDPQTNGGLLIAVDTNAVEEVKKLLKENGLENFAEPIGQFIASGEKTITVKI